jgi:2-polyprenyl-6-methoxyphenol hydroxylase-like FAD-dependent oxidoreductase
MRETDVLICGAGPSGLMLAAQLAQRGVRFELIEKRRERTTESRALAIQARTLELLDDLDLTDAFLELGNVAAGIEFFARGEKQVDAEFVDIGAEDTPYPFLFFLSQADTERLLEEGLARRNVRVRRGVELIDCRTDAEGVVARLRGEGDYPEEVRARYLVGCDGAHSAVRKAAGIAFEGAAYRESFLLGDVRAEWALGANRLMVFVGKSGVVAHFPLRGGISRFIVTGQGEDLTADTRLELAELESAVRPIVEHPVSLHDPVWLTRFHLHHRVAAHYRAQRLLLVGDAAHIHSPAGGQGMNTGIQDAVNLGWKLAQCLRGGPEGLLDSYERERRPVGVTLLRTTDRFFEIATSTRSWARLLRLYAIGPLLRFVLAKRSRRKRAFRFVSQLGIHYRGSPLVSGSPRAARLFAPGAPRPGDRAPDGEVLAEGVGPTTLFRIFRGPGHDLLHFLPGEGTRVSAELGADLAEPLRVHRIKDGKDLHRYGIRGESLYLIRPDGHVGYRGPADDLDSLRVYLRKLTG